MAIAALSLESLETLGCGQTNQLAVKVQRWTALKPIASGDAGTSVRGMARMLLVKSYR
jgi:hypothetical protein